jgi:inorganic phosphate transporter, PiT family
MATAWLITLPTAGVVGAITYWIVNGIGGYAGAAIGFALLVAVSGAIYMQSRRAPINSKNVNDEWEDGLVPASAKQSAGEQTETPIPTA